jgi:hypothetical protein
MDSFAAFSFTTLSEQPAAVPELAPAEELDLDTLVPIDEESNQSGKSFFCVVA